MELFNRSIRMLYGKSPIGEYNRKAIKISITPETMDMITKTVSFGKGRYGSAFIELAIRLLSALANSGEEIDLIANELYSVNQSPYLRRNLLRLVKLMDKYADRIPVDQLE